MRKEPFASPGCSLVAMKLQGRRKIETRKPVEDRADAFSACLWVLVMVMMDFVMLVQTLNIPLYHASTRYSALGVEM